jgi:hypothetical protein
MHHRDLSRRSGLHQHGNADAHPTYTGCTAFGLNATVDMNGCLLGIHASGLTDVECFGKGPIALTATTLCTVTIDTQTGISKLTYSNVGGTFISIAEAEDIVYTVDKSSAFCPLAAGPKEDGVYEGKMTVTGEAKGGGGAIGLSWDS